MYRRGLQLLLLSLEVMPCFCLGENLLVQSLKCECVSNEIQYCAKVMRTNFDEFRALFSSKYRRTFDRYFAAFARHLTKFRRQFAKASEKSNRKIARLIEKSLVRIFEAAKYRRRFTSNQMKYPPTFRLQNKRPINVISHGKT